MRTNFRMEDKNITMIRGDTLSFGLEIYDNHARPMDIDTAFFTCKQNFTDEVNVFQKTMNSGITKLEKGLYVVRVAPEDTENVKAGKYFYDFQVGANDDIFTIMKGVLEIEQDITI